MFVLSVPHSFLGRGLVTLSAWHDAIKRDKGALMYIHFGKGSRANDPHHNLFEALLLVLGLGSVPWLRR